jgi:hypothetical protein
MPIFPFDDEEEKRRRRYASPGINPNAGLPEIALPKRPMLPGPGNPGAMPAPEYAPQDMAPPSRYQRYQSEKEGYMRGTPGRGKSALTGALQAFLGGGGLIGAGMGALQGATDPRGLREQQFNQRRRPQILEQFGMEDAERQAQRQVGADELNAQYKQAQIGELQSQAHKNRLPPPRRAPVHSDRGLYDVEGGGIIPGTEPLPKPETPSYQNIVDPDGKIRTYQVFPGGRKIPVGVSGAAAISQANIRSREKVASQHEAGANARAARVDARVTAKPKPGSKGDATKADIEEAFRRVGGHAAGWTLKGMKKHFKDQGFRVPE